MKDLTKILNKVSWIVLAFYAIVHSGFALSSASKESVTDKVYVIESDLLYKMINPWAFNALGTSFPFLQTGFVNQTAVDSVGASVDGVVKHEAHHIQLYDKLGFVSFYHGIDKWKREGLADYARDGPTLNPCDDLSGMKSVRVDYRNYFVAVTYLREGMGMSEEQILQFDSYPLAEANGWFANNKCGV